MIAEATTAPVQLAAQLAGMLTLATDKAFTTVSNERELGQRDKLGLTCWR